jgi:cytochrome P450
MRDSLIDRILDGTIKPDVALTDSQLNNTLLGTLHQAASDTSASATLTSILFLAKYPEFQAKARAELDSVCGTDRLPRWSDFMHLPYINCIVKESLRIRPVYVKVSGQVYFTDNPIRTPNGIPYRAKENVWYNGMLIPKNATVFLPIYALNHTYYSDADTYNPDRYLGHPKSSSEYAVRPDYENRDHYTFGSGRRFCIGIHLAERSLWRMIAQILWAFKIEKVPSAVLDLDAYDGGIAFTPTAFKVRLAPRSARHIEVVQEASAEAKQFLSRWE